MDSFSRLLIYLNQFTIIPLSQYMNMRVADFIIEYIHAHGTDTIFTLAGGGAMFLNDATIKHGKIRYICNHHEQASALAAEAYAKMKSQIGAVMVTSGPGSTNAITGLMEAYQNSIPVLFISSQTKKSQMIRFSKIPSLRQFGVQEVDIIPIVSHLTKYAAIVENPEDVLYELEKAYYCALSGRPGPVWLDIPSDVASSPLSKHLKIFSPPKQKNNKNLDKQIKKIADILFTSKKPLIIAGGGIKLAQARQLFSDFVNKTHIPVVCPEMGIDLLPYNHPQYVGHGGTKGDRAANIVIQQSDLVISIGSRLAVPFIGHEYHTWAPNAYKIVIDIDPTEHKKKTIKINLLIKSDVRYALKKLDQVIGSYKAKDTWVTHCQRVKSSFALLHATESTNKTNEINMYEAVGEISKQSKPGDVFISDAGITAYVSAQSIKIKENQRMILPGATLTMGYNVPAIIGVWAADPSARILCITGDGSFQMNIHELAVISHHAIPAKIFITNNQGYLAIRTTQKLYFDKRLIGEGKNSGVSFPNTANIAQAYGFKYVEVKRRKDLREKIKSVLAYKGPIICDIHVPYWQDHITISSKRAENGKMTSLPIDDMYPFLSSEEKTLLKYEE